MARICFGNRRGHTRPHVRPRSRAFQPLDAERLARARLTT
jgi:hypothetical protein